MVAADAYGANSSAEDAAASAAPARQPAYSSIAEDGMEDDQEPEGEEEESSFSALATVAAAASESISSDAHAVLANLSAADFDVTEGKRDSAAESNKRGHSNNSPLASIANDERSAVENAPASAAASNIATVSAASASVANSPGANATMAATESLRSQQQQQHHHNHHHHHHHHQQQQQQQQQHLAPVSETALSAAASTAIVESMTPAQHKQLLISLRSLKRLKDAQFFLEPVDPVKFQIPDYPLIITNPMDLGTMEQKLIKNAYPTVEALVADFDLMVRNCIRYNGSESVFSDYVTRLRRAFDRHLEKLPSRDSSSNSKSNNTHSHFSSPATAAAAANATTTATATATATGVSSRSKSTPLGALLDDSGSSSATPINANNRSLNMSTGSTRLASQRSSKASNNSASHQPASVTRASASASGSKRSGGDNLASRARDSSNHSANSSSGGGGVNNSGAANGAIGAHSGAHGINAAASSGHYVPGHGKDANSPSISSGVLAYGELSKYNSPAQQLAAELNFALSVIKEFWKKQYQHFASPFLTPVDRKKYPEYYETIKTPMDLGTIKKRLEDNYYDNVADLESDVALIFNNCAKFNPVGHILRSFSLNLENMWQSKWSSRFSVLGINDASKSGVAGGLLKKGVGMTAPSLAAQKAGSHAISPLGNKGALDSKLAKSGQQSSVLGYGASGSYNASTFGSSSSRTSKSRNRNASISGSTPSKLSAGVIGGALKNGADLSEDENAELLGELEMQASSLMQKIEVLRHRLDDQRRRRAEARWHHDSSASSAAFASQNSDIGAGESQLSGASRRTPGASATTPARATNKSGAAANQVISSRNSNRSRMSNNSRSRAASSISMANTKGGSNTVAYTPAVKGSGASSGASYQSGNGALSAGNAGMNGNYSAHVNKSNAKAGSALPFENGASGNLSSTRGGAMRDYAQDDENNLGVSNTGINQLGQGNALSNESAAADSETMITGTNNFDNSAHEVHVSDNANSTAPQTVFDSFGVPLPTPLVTYEMKKELSDRIANVIGDKLQQVLAIIQEQMPNLSEGGTEEIVLDIASLDNYTLYRLWLLVTDDEDAAGVAHIVDINDGAQGMMNARQSQALQQPQSQQHQKSSTHSNSNSGGNKHGALHSQPQSHSSYSHQNRQSPSRVSRAGHQGVSRRAATGVLGKGPTSLSSAARHSSDEEASESDASTSGSESE